MLFWTARIFLQDPFAWGTYFRFSGFFADLQNLEHTSSGLSRVNKLTME